MSVELLNLEIELSGTYWNKRPEFSVWFDDEKILQDKIVFDTHTVKLERELSPGEHELKIRLENKQPSDTLKDDNNNIVNDMLLNIVSISIGDVPLDQLIRNAEYHLDEPQDYHGKTITRLDSCVNLGWNGSYVLKFSSPFYIWLLEKL